MWLLKVPLFLLLIGGAKSKEDSQFVLEEYYQEVSQIYEKANKIHLEYELATGTIGALEVAERILDKEMDAIVLEEYVNMEISGGLKEQNEMLELFEKAEEVKTSDQLKDDVEDAFTLMDGFGDLKNELYEFNPDDVEMDIKRLEKIVDFDDNLNTFRLARTPWALYDDYDYIQGHIKLLSQLPEDKELSDDEKLSAYKALHGVNALESTSIDTHKLLVEYGLFNNLQGLEYFKRTQDIPEKLNSMMNEIKHLEELASEIPKIEKEMEMLEELRDGNEVKEFKNRFGNLIKSSDFFEDFNTATNFHEEYRSIQSISPLLQKIKSFSSKMRTFEARTSRIFKELSLVEVHFEISKISPGSLTEKFSGFKECLQNFDFQISYPMEISADFGKKLTRLRSFDLEIQDYAKRLKELEEKAKNLIELIQSKYTSRAKADRDLVSLLQTFLNENKWILDFYSLDKIVKTHPSLPDKEFNTFEYKLIETHFFIKELDFDNVRKVSEDILKYADKPKQFLECYSNLGVTASDMKELLVLPGKVWNFDPKVLEGTVEVVGMFIEAYKMIEDIKEWKMASNPEIENFPLDGEDVKAVSDGINVLETIRNVANGWKMMKTLDIGNSGIKESWDLLDSSLSQFFEILSSQKIWNLSNVSFPTNLPIDTIRTFIEDVYQEDQRNDILNFLKEIQKLETDFPEYPNKLEKMNEAMGKMKEWENGKTNTVKEMVDCFENECDVSLKLPEASS